ncbi:MAG: DUF554 domain-containing protein [Spirochaetales bacterium]|nr:DUF554 domain-containing protein [Spirochaetales bacterium]
MIATIINCITVLIGSLLGVLFSKKIGEEFKTTIFTGLGIFTMVIGFQMALDFSRVLYVVFSLVAGGLIGFKFDLEGKVLLWGENLEKRFDRPRPSAEGMDEKNNRKGNFAHGFLNASLLFCVGAMTIVGAMKAGMEKDYDLLLTKSVMDGFAAIAFASAMGIGVAFSIIVLLIYQGGLTLLAMWFGNFASPLIMSELTAVGGMLIIMIGINLLGLRKIKTANFLPALVLIILFAALEPIAGPFFKGLLG